MSEKNIPHKEQLKDKPKIEDIVCERLDGEIKKNALDFIEYLRSEKMSPQRKTNVTSWKSSYRQRLMCFINFYQGVWQIRPVLYNTSNPCDPCDFDKFIKKENLEKFIWGNIKSCRNCLPCTPGINIIIAGKEFHNKCGYNTIQINNPDIAAINNVKIILEYIKNTIINRM